MPHPPGGEATCRVVSLPAPKPHHSCISMGGFRRAAVSYLGGGADIAERCMHCGWPVVQCECEECPYCPVRDAGTCPACGGCPECCICVACGECGLLAESVCTRCGRCDICDREDDCDLSDWHDEADVDYGLGD